MTSLAALIPQSGSDSCFFTAREARAEHTSSDSSSSFGGSSLAVYRGRTHCQVSIRRCIIQGKVQLILHDVERDDAFSA